ncbi:hypothetical protein HUJ04_006154 [Dendroctonus ponderosae]|uniref:Uncharacterized protein n=1 Tax=Dendroctonus ponderosae TaxID=77166 RepID=J3JZ08_DENPD
MLVLRRLYASQAKSKRFFQRKNIPDPGIAKQKTLLDLDAYDIDDFETTDYEALEADFMNVHKSHKEHFSELEARKEREKLLIVKQKYFKQHLPNFLTWQDTEQIRYLHNNNPEEWTIERLTEGFPATAEVIQKVAKGKWAKKTENRIRNHDKTVLQNWNDFKQGKLKDLPEELKEHLKKFSNRTLNFETHAKELIAKSQVRVLPGKGEFSEIISSYQRMQESKLEKPEVTEIEDRRDVPEVKPRKQMSKLVTFKELQAEIRANVMEEREISPEDKLLSTASFPRKDDTETVDLVREDIAAIIGKRHETKASKGVGFVRETSPDLSHLIYPEHITIPRGIYKRGFTYKLNDCYYDSNGQFLYRVPGMG